MSINDNLSMIINYTHGLKTKAINEHNSDDGTSVIEFHNRMDLNKFICKMNEHDIDNMHVPDDTNIDKFLFRGDVQNALTDEAYALSSSVSEVSKGIFNINESEFRPDNLDIKQDYIIDKLIAYIKIRNPIFDKRDIRDGLCHGLCVLFAYEEFRTIKDGDKKPKTFTERLLSALNTDLSSIQSLENTSYKDLTHEQQELEHLVNDILYLHAELPTSKQSNFLDHLITASNDPVIQKLESRVHNFSSYSYDDTSNSYASLQNMLHSILKCDTDKQKFILFSTGDHAISISYKNGYCTFYDPNFDFLPSSYKFDKDEPQSLSELIKVMTKMLEVDKKTFSLGIDVISPEVLEELASNKDHLEIDLIEVRECDYGDKHSPLWIAAQNGHADTLKILLGKGADFTLANAEGMSPLSIAAQNGHTQIVKTLYERGAKLNRTDNEGRSPLWIAAHLGDTETVKALKEMSAKCNKTDNRGRSPLWIAACFGHTETVKALRKMGAKLNKTDNGGRSPLWIAAQSGRTEIVKVLLEMGAKVNLTDKEGCSPLWIAAQSGRTEIVKVLLEMGAKVNLTDKEGRSPLWIAAQYNHIEIIRALKKMGAKLKKTDKEGRSPLWMAARYDNIEIVKALKKMGADLDCTDKEGRSPLWMAAQYGQTKKVKTLKKLGANFKKTDLSGQSPLSIAKKNGHRKTVKALKIMIANLNRIDINGCSSLWKAARNGHTKKVKTLKEMGANVNLTDFNGCSPLSIAAQNGHTETVKVLKDNGCLSNC